MGFHLSKRESRLTQVAPVSRVHRLEPGAGAYIKHGHGQEQSATSNQGRTRTSSAGFVGRRKWTRYESKRCDSARRRLFTISSATEQVLDVQISRPGAGSPSKRTGTLHLTAHHLTYTYDGVEGATGDGQPKPEELWKIPYPLINHLSRPPQTLQGLCPLAFRTRSFEAFVLYFVKDIESLEVFETVKELTVIASVTHLYAFFYTPEMPISSDGRNGWELYNVQKEYMRQGVGTRTKAWRLTDINKDYSFSPTYPAKLVVPARIGDATLTYAGKYRSKARIPTLSYLHWSNHGSITRCSQPLVGIKQNRSIQDEKLVEAIFQSHLSVESPYSVALPDPRSASGSKQEEKPVYGATCMNVIIDARPTANAMANVAQGGGSENMDHYKGGTGLGFGITKKAYLGIDNIHVMRDSLAKVVDALREPDSEMSQGGTTDPTSEVNPTGIIDRQALRRSGWLRHLSAVLQGMLIVVRTVHVASSHVLVHCSDGWDRTAQVTALSQLCLDPYYRTIRGFMVLVEKEWVSFGHKFLDRCGHLSSERFFTGGSSDGIRGGEPGDDAGGGAGAFIAGFRDRISNPSHIKEMSPVFHQFLECVRNIQRQYPDRFEFNELFLRKIHWHLYACQFGTFLFNCERERRVSLDGASSWSGIQKTTSVWEWFLSDENMKEKRWNNPTYDKALDDVKGGAGDMGVLIPSARNVRFWNELYGRGDEEMNGKPVADPPQADPELKVVADGMDDSPLLQGLAKGLNDVSLSSSGTMSEAPSRNGTPLLSTSVTSAPSGTRTTSRGPSPAILAVSESPPIPATTHVPATSRPPPPGQMESFRPYAASSTSAFSLRSSPNPSAQATQATLPPLDNFGQGNDPYALYQRAKPPQPAARTAQSTSETNQPYSAGMFPTSSLTDGFTGLATNAGGGMKSLWGRLSSSTSAAFSAVQDVTKDYRPGGNTFTGYSGSGQADTAYRDSSRSGGTSALGWGSSDGWGSSAASPVSASPSMYRSTDTGSLPATIRPKPQVGTLRSDSLSNNPWGTPVQPATVGDQESSRIRSLEDEWKTATAGRASVSGGLASNSNLSNPLNLVAPTPRHASTLSPASTLTTPLSATLPQPSKSPTNPSTDPLGVGPL